jgi:hypothetical protein
VHATGTLKEKPSSKPVSVYLPPSSTSRVSTKAKSVSPRPSHHLHTTPELSVVSADGQVLGIDVHTGLPKLAVELLPEMEEAGSMGAQLNRNTQNVSDASSPSPTASSSKRERKSVSFDTNSDLKRQRSMSDSKVSRLFF